MTPNDQPDDRLLTCSDCRMPFVFGGGEAAHFARLGFQLPKRCPKCREAKREARERAEGR